MKFALLFFLLLISSCYDEIPVTEKMKLPVDNTLLGTWKIVSEYNSREGRWDDFEEKGQMVILKWSEKEYVVNFSDLYFRAYGISLNTKRQVLQTELLKRDNQYITSKYSVWEYENRGDTLIISLLNHNLLNTTFTEPDSGKTDAVYVKNSRQYERVVRSYADSDSLFFNVYRCVRDRN